MQIIPPTRAPCSLTSSRPLPYAVATYGGVCGFVGVSTFIWTVPWSGTPLIEVAHKGYPGAIIIGLFFLTFSNFFLTIALEDSFGKRFKKRPMARIISATFFSIGLKSVDDLKDPTIDSDEALCFFLVDGYFSIFNAWKRYGFTILLIAILASLTYVSSFAPWTVEYDKYNGDFYNASSYLIAQAPVAVLIFMKVAADLQPPSVRLEAEDYAKVKHKSTLIHQIMNLAGASGAPAEARSDLTPGRDRVDKFGHLHLSTSRMSAHPERQPRVARVHAEPAVSIVNREGLNYLESLNNEKSGTAVETSTKASEKMADSKVLPAATNANATKESTPAPAPTMAHASLESGALQA